MDGNLTIALRAGSITARLRDILLRKVGERALGRLGRADVLLEALEHAFQRGDSLESLRSRFKALAAWITRRRAGAATTPADVAEGGLDVSADDPSVRELAELFERILAHRPAAGLETCGAYMVEIPRLEF